MRTVYEIKFLYFLGVGSGDASVGGIPRIVPREASMQVWYDEVLYTHSPNHHCNLVTPVTGRLKFDVHRVFVTPGNPGIHLSPVTQSSYRGS